MTRAILHVDMDAFYASVEERDDPELRGKPVIVGGTRGRGVVAAANYAVRRFGVRSAMPIGEALRRCPHAICVHPRMSRYAEVSRQVFAIFNDVTPLVEGLSLDEAFLDVTGSERLLGNASTIATDIRRRILRETGLTASVGIAPNKLLAKIASDLNKPDGMFRIGSDNLHAVLDPLPVERLFGVGPKTLPAVHAAGIRTVGDLRHADKQCLWRAFGKHGGAMQERAAGIDERPVVADREEKSMSAEETFRVDLRDVTSLRTELTQLADRASARLRAGGMVAGTVTVKIRRADFKTYTRQRSIEPPSQDSATVNAVALTLLTEWLQAEPGAAVRLLGVGCSGLRAAGGQSDLFAQTAASAAPATRLDAAVDDIRRRFGAGVLTRASRLQRGSS
jgi:DNA polymerase-4